MSRLSLLKGNPIYQSQANRVCIFKGSFGPKGIPVAIKEQIHTSLNEANTAIREAMNQVQLDHEFICKVFDCFLESSGASDIKSVIVTELMDTDLSVEIAKRAESLTYWSESDILDLGKRLVSALLYAQSKGVSHRDVKPQNVFLSSGKVKIGDFGSSASNLTMDPHSSSLQGSPFYFSPELKNQYLSLLEGNAERFPYDPFVSDVYSLGVTLLYMARLKSPMELTSIKNLTEATERLIRECFQYPKLQDLLRRMLVVDPRERVSLEKLSQSLTALTELGYDEEEKKMGKELREKPSFRGCSDSSELSQCQKCHKLLFSRTDEIAVSDETVLQWSVYCTCEQDSNPVAKCTICAKSIFSQAWSDSIPESLQMYVESVNTLCSMDCLLRLSQLATGHEEVVATCANCKVPISSDSLTQGIALQLTCTHIFHNADCCYKYLKMLSGYFTIPADYPCPECGEMMLSVSLKPHFGKGNLRIMHSIVLPKICDVCGIGIALYSLPCHHSSCIDCALRSDRRCGKCNDSGCFAF